MPFRNLKLFMIFSKLLGVLSCKLVNNRLKSSSVWSRCFCVIWILLHCLYMGIYYYNMYTASPAEKAKNDFALAIMRTTTYFVSLFPYHFVAIFWSENIVKLSNKLLTYDEQAIALKHQRKDKHIFIYLFFVYTFITISWKTYNDINENISKKPSGLLDILLNLDLNVCGTYCVLITCIFLDLIRQRFRHLNQMIVPHVSELPVTGAQDEITVYDVRYLHGVLLDSAELINTIYGIGTLITFISMLLQLISVIYIFIKDFQKNKIEQDNIIKILDMLFQIIYLFAMYHFTTYEANHVEERVIKYGLSFRNKCRMDKIEMMLYFYHKRYSFTAVELFPLNLTIFLPVTTMIITYLTLIL